MATLIADTIKARASFPVAYGSEINVSNTDSRTVAEALEDAGSIATKTSTGIVQVGDGIDVTEEGVISTPFYAEVGDTEPENKDRIWIDTSAVYNPTGDEIPISEEEGNAIQSKSDGLFVQNNTYSTDEVVIGTWNNKPLYRKVITVSLTSTAQTRYTLDIPTEADIVDYSGIFLRNTVVYKNAYSSTESFSYEIINNVDGEKFLYAQYSMIAGTCSMRFVVEYTKTTD